ncbi:MAG: hypothetical protein ACI35S_00665 [Anaeroplasma sp.]
MEIKCYSELKKLKTFNERFNYLKLDGVIGEETFGYDRILNQVLYKSKKWREVRNEVLVRDNGNDLGVEGYQISGKAIIHHMNPITVDDVLNEREWIYDPEYLITVSNTTHNAIHYSSEDILPKDPIKRSKNDTCLWKK